MIGTRTGGVDSQHAEIKLIPQPAAVVNDTTADQIYDVTGVGPQLKDKSGVAFPLIVGADGIGVAGVAFANTPYTCAVLDRVVPGYYHRLDASGNVERRPAARTPRPRTS